MTKNKIFLSAIVLVTFSVGAALGGAFVYSDTREKWYQLGHERGVTQGRLLTMVEVCQFKTTDVRLEKPYHSISAKTSVLSLKPGEGGVSIACILE